MTWLLFLNLAAAPTQSDLVIPLSCFPKETVKQLMAHEAVDPFLLPIPGIMQSYRIQEVPAGSVMSGSCVDDVRVFRIEAARGEAAHVLVNAHCEPGKLHVYSYAGLDGEEDDYEALMKTMKTSAAFLLHYSHVVEMRK